MIIQNLRFALLLAACLATACTQELVETTTLTISARLEAGSTPATRTVLDENNGVSFVSTDALAVFDGTRRREFTAEKVYPDGSADFTGAITTAQDSHYAVYPHEAGLALQDNKVLVRIPNIQTATAGSFDPKANVSIGCTEKTAWGAQALTLKNVCSLVKFSVPEGRSYAAAVLLTGSDAILTGDLYYTMDGVPTFYNATDDYQRGIVTLKGNITGGHWYYIAVNPCTLEGGFALYFYDSEEALAKDYYATYKATDKTVTLGAARSSTSESSKAPGSRTSLRAGTAPAPKPTLTCWAPSRTSNSSSSVWPMTRTQASGANTTPLPPTLTAAARPS